MAKKITLNEVGEMLEHVVKHMATKEDVERLEGKFDSKFNELETKVDTLQIQVNSIEQQLRTTRVDTRLGDLEERVFGGARR
jgi:flagellar capping protein FliD